MISLAAACGDDTEPTLDAAPPVGGLVVTVDAPAGGAQLTAAEPVAITWTAQDPAGTPVVVDVVSVAEGGATAPIAAGLAGAPGTLTWAPPGVAAPTRYKIRVTATGAGGATAVDESDAFFTVSPPATGVSLARDLQPVFTARCTTQFCHGTASQVALLHLAPGFAHGSLVEVSSQSSACNAYKRVRPGLPDQSYLMWKLAGTGPCLAGVRMPKGAAALPPAEMSLIRDWISAGAKNN